MKLTLQCYLRSILANIAQINTTVIIMSLCTYLMFMYSSAHADSIDYTKKKLICDYDLTVMLQDDTVLFIVVPLVGKLKYTIRTDYGQILHAVDFGKDLKKINQDHFYNPKFISNMDEYKCREA